MKRFKITCYRETKSYPESQRQKMMKYYLEGMACSDGSERDRYTNIYLDLAAGKEHCYDEDLAEREWLKQSNGRNTQKG